MKSLKTSSDGDKQHRSDTSVGSHRRQIGLFTIFGFLMAETVTAAPAAIGLRVLPSKTPKLSHHRRTLKYIFDEDDLKDGQEIPSSLQDRGAAPSRSSESRTSSSQSSSMLHDIVSAFQQAVTPKKKMDDANVHVGKLLTAMSKMESHMRQVGMSQAANDIKGNHDKVLRLYTAAPKERRDSVRSLLEWELETGIHGENSNNGPIRVKNNSGAMGLFWIGHTVKYQYDLYRLMMEEGMNPIDAATLAFQKDLEPHLPWAASKMAKAMIPRATPSTQLEFFKALGGYEEGSYGQEEHAGMTENVKSIINVWDDMLNDWYSPFADLRLSDI
ncbi:glycolipid transfer protein GLTP [Nitzschia inconspicua]|uniref:Glycolipid transfer protein GLTP n=1 Tax=Nitzschia inconspicua TaxID=303405 RepID=A0A9K3PTL4_9STRA|nr:glycolipid transfer protein GLTP [Nitzschia inconspicua]